MELSFIVVGLNFVKQNYGDHMVAKLIHHQIETHGNGLKKLIIDLGANSSVTAALLVTLRKRLKANNKFYLMLVIRFYAKIWNFM